MNMVPKPEAIQPMALENETATVLSIVARAAADPNVDIDKLERLMQMQERAVQRQAEQEFNAALNRAQSRMGRIATDAVNRQTSSKYATYAALDRALRPLYTQEGFSLSFDTAPEAPEGHARVMCRVSHAGGFTRSYQVDIPVDGKGAKGNDVMTKTHAVGSGMSYGMRYLLKMIFNVAIGEADDDGNAAGGRIISFDEAATLKEWIEATNTDLTTFLGWIGAESLETMPASSYAKALAGLKKKAKK